MQQHKQFGPFQAVSNKKHETLNTYNYKKCVDFNHVHRFHMNQLSNTNIISSLSTFWSRFNYFYKLFWVLKVYFQLPFISSPSTWIFIFTELIAVHSGIASPWRRHAKSCCPHFETPFALRAQLWCLNMLSRQLTRFWNRAGVCAYDNSSYGFLIIGVSHRYFIGPTGKSDSGKYSKLK